MACYEGETLKEKIEKGVLNIDEAIDITLQICEGLKKPYQNYLPGGLYYCRINAGSFGSVKKMLLMK